MFVASDDVPEIQATVLQQTQNVNTSSKSLTTTVQVKQLAQVVYIYRTVLSIQDLHRGA